jgi:hypothetical protein
MLGNVLIAVLLLALTGALEILVLAFLDALSPWPQGRATASASRGGVAPINGRGDSVKAA